MTSLNRTLRGLRTGHVHKLSARKPGDPDHRPEHDANPVRVANLYEGTVTMHEVGKSDKLIVPKIRSNNARAAVWVAEIEEERKFDQRESASAKRGPDTEPGNLCKVRLIGYGRCHAS